MRGGLFAILAIVLAAILWRSWPREHTVPEVTEETAPAATPGAVTNRARPVVRSQGKNAVAAHRAKVVGDSVLGTSVLPQPAEIERLIRAGDLEAAENALEELLRATPKNSEALVQLGLLYAALRNQPERAIPFFRKAIEANPEHEAALDRLLVSTTRTRGIGDSEKTLRDLHSLFPDSSNLNGEMGRMLMSQGRTTEAVAHFERATAKRPSPDNQLDLADALAAAGQSERAREIAQRILKRDPGNGAAIDLLTSLRQDSRPN